MELSRLKALLTILTLPLLLLMHSPAAEAKITCKAAGSYYVPKARTCACYLPNADHTCDVSGKGGGQPTAATPGKKKPRYEGRGNKYCQDLRPKARNISGISIAGNGREQYMQKEIYDYVRKLKETKGCGNLVIQSTFRNCDANKNARGVSRSFHLCGGAADTTCGGSSSKGLPRKICENSGLDFVDEGPSRYPHCELLNRSCWQ